MRGDLPRAIDLCLAACETIPADNLSLRFDRQVTLGYEYFLSGDYASASQILNEAIQAATATGALIYTVAAACFMARLHAVQGQLHQASETYQKLAHLIPEASGEHRDARALVEVGMADLLCERNQLDAALAHVREGLALLPWWGKVDDLVLAYITLARIELAQANRGNAKKAVEEATQLVQTRGVFPEARNAVKMAQVRLWLAEGDLHAAARWAAIQEKRLSSDGRFGVGDELAQISLARVWIAHNKPHEATSLLAHLEETARAAGRMGRVIEILLLEALARQALGDSGRAIVALAECLAMAEPEGYARVFLDEGLAMQMLLAQWLSRADPGTARDYAARLLSQFDAEAYAVGAAQTSPAGELAEPLSEREREVLHLVALGMTNKEIAQQLIVAPGTVKAHTASIYRKLDVANRTEAVARAREFGILP
jgi:LuxR family transcriptional regulator, maltose regulon positive regulatory protein